VDPKLITPLLIVGRLVYRYFSVVATAQPMAAGPNANPFAVYQNSPWTAGIFGVLVAYYILYYLGILLKAARSHNGPSEGRLRLTAKPIMPRQSPNTTHVQRPSLENSVGGNACGIVVSMTPAR
jgi:hypothetical protein